MRRFDEGRYEARLATAEAVAAPHLEDLALAGGTVSPPPGFEYEAQPDPVLLERAAAIPPEAIPSVRIALLRRIVESDVGAAESPQGHVRARLADLARLGIDDLALELALCAFGVDLGFGVTLAWRRVALLDPTVADLDRLGRVDGIERLALEAARLAEILANDTMILDPVATERRLRLLGSIERLRPGTAAALAFDRGDPFGAAMGTIAETDEAFSRALGAILPLARKATSVLPERGQRASISTLVTDETATRALRGAATRLVQRLLIAPLTPRGPGLVPVRPSNQRLVRAVVGLVPSLLPGEAADVLGEVGVRMGTSGQRDNQARDAAVAGSCAALLGDLDDEAGVASLARMLARVRNKPVRKQVEKALTAAAERTGTSVEELMERSLPTFGVGPDGRRVFDFDAWTAEIRIEADGHVRVSWTDGDAEPADDPPRRLREDAAGEVAGVAAVADDIRATLSDERHRLEGLLGDDRRWSVAEWRRRFLEHPLGRVHGRRTIWRFTGPSATLEAITADGSVTDPAGAVVSMLPDEATVEIWHPVEASADSVDRWRHQVVTRRVTQPFKQAFRETYRIDLRSGADGVLDRRFADRPLAYGRMRALMGSRGWTAPMLGPFDQGDRATAFKDLARAGLRAELLHTPAGLGDRRERVEYARSGSLRFTKGTDDGRSPVLLADVPPRVLSEALRDVDLFTSVPDPMRRPSSATEGDGSPPLAVRADAMRRLLATLGWDGRASVLGLWLRVETPESAWAISLATGATVRLPDEEVVDVPLPDPPPEVGYLPLEDEVLRTVLVTAIVLLDRPR
jgi:hypothetical protein